MRYEKSKRVLELYADNPLGLTTYLWSLLYSLFNKA